MTTSTSPRTQWHTEILVHGRLYPTRHYDPQFDDFAGSNWEAMDLPDEQIHYNIALHEAAHAVLHLAGGCAHLEYATVTRDRTAELGGTVIAKLHDEPGKPAAYAMSTVAGERAQDRWLHENDLWTPKRACAVELGARSDRASLLHHNPHIGFGDQEVDFAVVQAMADAAMAPHWDAITAVANELAVREHLTGDEIASISGLPNRPIPTTPTAA